MSDWSIPYEAPISLDGGRVLGSRPLRATLWTFAAIAGGLPLLVLFLMSLSLSTFLSRGNADLASTIQTWLFIAIAPTLLLWLACMVLANDFGHRPAEYWFKVWTRHRALPKRLEDSALRKHHSGLKSIPRGCVEIVGPTNLRMSDEATLSSNIKRLGVFFNGLRFPVQIIVRAWPTSDGLIERRWFVALTAPTDAVLTANVQAIVDGLNRAGLRGHAKNGDLFDTLQRCWTNRPLLKDHLGPQRIDRDARYVVVDGEYVRGFLMARYPHTVDANWLAPLLDGDMACDFSMWLDPTDNAEERDYLASRIVMWQTAQVLNTNQGIPPNPDIEDQINDAKRTRLLLQRRELRVFRATVAFIVRGATHAEMTERESLLRDQLRECVGDEALIPLDYEHDRVPLMAVPTGEPPLEYPLRTVTPAVARGYPFSNSSVAQPGGVDVGTSVGSRRTNKINPFSVANPHMLVLGTTGAGKGFWVKVFLWRLLQAHPEMVVYIIQAEKDEYSALAEAMPPLPYAEHRVDPVFSHEHPQPLQLLRARTWAEGSSPTGIVHRITGLNQMDGIYSYKPTHRLAAQRLTVYDLTPMPPAERGTGYRHLTTGD